MGSSLIRNWLFLPIIGLASTICACHDDNGVPRQQCRAVAFYPQGPGQTFVRFTDRDLADIPMTDTNDDQVLEAVISGEPGQYNYLIFQDGSSFLDSYNTRSAYSFNYGQEVSQLVIPDCHRPKVDITSLVADGNGELWLTGQWYRNEEGSDLDASTLEIIIDHTAHHPITIDENGIFSFQTGKLPLGKHHLEITGRDTAGHTSNYKNTAFWTEKKPFSWQDSQIYQIMVDRFADENGALPGTGNISFFHGGNLKGIIKQMEAGYFDRFASNVIWLSPLYKNPDGQFQGRDGFYSEPYHGYWSVDHRAIDSRFGSEEDLHNLVKLAHSKGIRIILDSVLNHVHIQNSYFVDHVNEGWFNNPDGKCICGVTCDWGPHYYDCWFDPFLADLSWQYEEQISDLVDDHIYWLEKYDLDGLRLDAIAMMPRLAARRMRSAIEEHFDPAGTHVYLLGENYTNRGQQQNLRYYLGPQTLSGLFDFPVMWAIRDAFTGANTLKSLDLEIKNSEAAWDGSGAVMGMFLGNHDIPRLISVLNGDTVWSPREIQPQKPTADRPYDLFKLAWTVLFTLPGAPIIYYGDEVAIPGAYDPDNRRDMVFDNLDERELDLRNHVEKVSQMRAACQALRRGGRQTVYVTDKTYIYARYLDNQLILIALNMDPENTEFTFELPKKLIPAVPVTFTDLFSGEKFTLNSTFMKLNLDQSTIKVLAIAGSCGE